jgi:nucleotide-binding universal stress UspA family protein
MYRRILVPIDLADVELAKPALATAVMMAKESNGSIRLVNVLPMTPVMLAEYVPPDFEAQQRASAEEAIAIVAKETGLEPGKVSTIVRQGTIDREILDEAKSIAADLIVMSSHRAGMRTYFLGSNAGHVVRYASCSVLVVRHQPSS